MTYVRDSVRLIAFVLLVCGLAAAQGRLDRYALILQDSPLASDSVPGKGVRAASPDRMRTIQSAQQSIRSSLSERKIQTTGAIQTVLNAVFVQATPEQAVTLNALPGVISVQRMLPLKRNLNAALDLMNVPAAWNAIGGAQNAGAGVKIAILDTGIDHNHPAFKDDSFSAPAGFPKCQGNDCAFTNKKIIVARSYVSMLVLGDNPQLSRPDDLSPKDRVGHGTAAAMVAAGGTTSGPVATITGVAPKAFLGNYKIFGSPGVNDITFEDVLLQAIDDAVNDGMDIASVSLGSPAVWAPTDSGSTCGNQSNVPCDWRSDAIQNAARRGLTVVVSAGNDGNAASQLPSYSTIGTPGTAPSAITVGASTNSHIYFQTLQVLGSDTPSQLQRINALFGNGPRPASPLTAPLLDVSKLGDDGKACSALNNGSLNGAVALILRGDCSFDLKVNNAQRAGAVAVVIYQLDKVNGLFPMDQLSETGIPAVLIGNTAGIALKQLLASGTPRNVTLDPAFQAVTTQEFDTVADFSSQGPAIGTAAIKPEVIAVGTDLYMATQAFDPNGDMYDPSGYTVAQGSSFAAPLVAGAAAIVKGRNPQFTPAQLKSAVVNTASAQVTSFDANNQAIPARVTAVGAGKLDAAAAVKTTVTVEPATASFGVVGNTLPSLGLTLRNSGSSALPLTLRVNPRDTDRNATVALSSTSLILGPGESPQITVRLTGSKPQPGAYEGIIAITGGGSPLRVPYLYLVGDGVPYSVISLKGDGFVSTVNGRQTLVFKILDKYGVPVPNVAVRFRSTLGGGTIDTATATTDELGIGEATANIGSQLGAAEFIAEAGGLTAYFDGRVRPLQSIQTGGVVNAASLTVGQGLAPGSYISIYGRGLSEITRVANTPYLPLSLAGVSVSFDLPAKKLSVPARLQFVSDGQINVQIPWEFQGANTASMKVSIGDSSSAVYSVPLLDYSPAAFEYTEPASGRLLAAALDENYKLVTTANPLAKGRVVQIYANGLGPVDNQPPSGEITPAQPLASTRVLPVVTVGGKPAEVLFSGLAPFNVGLYQVNVRIPGDSPSGLQQVVITSNGISSKTTNLPIQ
jgi:minor extracellular serine protease Vpr